MQKQKKGFLLFISSLIPGAGEMYMGFFKQGISIMTLFWAIIAIAGGLNISSLVIFRIISGSRKNILKLRQFS